MSRSVEHELDEAPPANPISQRPVQIFLCTMGGFEDTASRQRDHWPGLRLFVDSLNSSQDLFEFKCNDLELDLNASDEDLLHGFTAEYFYNCLSKQLTSFADIKCGIGLTHTPLEKNEFNHHDQRRGVGVITIESYQQYIPDTGSLKRYLAYLVFCEAFCLAGRQQYEHSEHRKCLFDLCGDKPQLEDCLREPQICGECKNKLRESNFSSVEIASVEGALQRLAKPAFGSALNGALRRPTVNMIAGAGIAVAAATYSATEEGTLAWLPAIALGIAFLMFVGWEYGMAKLNRQLATHPKSRWLNVLIKPFRWITAKFRP